MTATAGADVAGSDALFDTSSDAPSDGGSESAADHAYFHELEDLFLGLRGAPLMLSPSDWQVAKEWHRRGIPLELVRRVLREVFEKRRQREVDDIVSLRYFRRPVEGAWKKVRELAAGGERAEPEAFDLTGRLERLAAALPEELRERERWAERIRALAEGAGEPGNPSAEAAEAAEPAGDAASDPAPDPAPEAPSDFDLEAVEETLGRLDGELLETAYRTLDADASAALRRRVDEALGRLEARLPAEEIARSREHLRRRLLRERLGLPVLSLFSPAAEGE